MDAEHSDASSRSPAGNRRSVTVIGGGLGGLVAAIRCAEQGVPVMLHEARRQLGGRARSTAPPFIANDGPHGLYADGVTWRFLLDRRVAVPMARPPAGGSRFHAGGRIRRMPPRAMLRAFRGMRRPAPVESDFRSWATRRWGDADARVLCGAAGAFTYHPDPGELSAAFVAERFAGCSPCRRRSGTCVVVGLLWWRRSSATPGHSAYASRRRVGSTGCPTHL